MSNTVKAKLDDYTTGAVDRWAGSDRFASSAAFSAKSFAAGVTVAYVANGMAFPDALSGAPIAGKTAGPVLLTRRRPRSPRRSPPSSRGSSRRRSSSSAAPAPVSNTVKAKLDAYTTGAVDRWAGSDRFASSATFSAKSYAAGVGVVYVANGMNFPDALSGAPDRRQEQGPGAPHQRHQPCRAPSRQS